MAKIQLEIVTPERKVFDQAVDIIIAKGKEGELGILANHIPLVTPLRIAPLRYRINNKEYSVSVQGGFIEVRGEKAVVLAESAEFPEQIDLARAQRAKERAESRLTDKNKEIDLVRAENALKRALSRIDVVSND